MGVAYLEWGICLLTMCFCWWKYGWNMEVMKGVRRAYRKFELILGGSEGTIKEPTITKVPTNTWDVKHFKRIPLKGVSFNPRSKLPSSTLTSKVSDPKETFFYKSLEQQNSPLKESSTPCFICTHPNKEVVLDEVKRGVGLKNCLDCEMKVESAFYMRPFSHFHFWWKKWFLGEQYHCISLKTMMKEERLNWAIEETARSEFKENPNGETTYEDLVKKHKKRAEATVRRMRAKQPKHPWYALYVRIASWIIGKFLGQIYPQILVRESQISLLQEARKSGCPILYLPIHRSHIDYVLISWTLVANDIRSPLVAAGENLNIPVFSLMMKSVGGFFIKRRLDAKEGKKDSIYRTMLHTYMCKSLMSDNDMEFFIEGGRTRTGKPSLPKGGLLSIVVDSLMTSKVSDILVVPVNFSYDRLLEGNYIREQLGQPKVNESFASAAMALWNSLQPKYGNARVDFGHPFSMKEFIKSFQAQSLPLSPQLSLNSTQSDEKVKEEEKKALSNVSNGSCSNVSDLCSTKQRALVDALGQHVIYDGVKCFTLMSTNAVAFILLNKYRQGVDMETLKDEIINLGDEMLERGHDSSFSHSDDMNQTLNHALKILGPTLVRREYKGLVKYLKPVSQLPNVIELSYYSNCVLPIYALEAIVGTSMLVEMKNAQGEVTEEQLLKTCLEYCEILHYEFILSPPCQPLSHSISNTIKFLIQTGTLKPVEGDSSRLLISDSKGLKRLEYLKSLLSPILDSYIQSASVLLALVDHEAEEKQLQMDMLAQIKGQLINQNIRYGESMALDPIRNFLSLVIRWEVLESFKKDLSTIYYLGDSFNSPQALQILINRLSKFRV